VGIRYKVNEIFFKTWSPTMAYLLGFIYADGALIDDKQSRGKYLSLTSTDPEIIENAKKWLGSEHTILKLPPLTPSRKEKSVLRIGSRALYLSLVKLGLYPNKSLIIQFPKNVPPEFLGTSYGVILMAMVALTCGDLQVKHKQ